MKQYKLKSTTDRAKVDAALGKNPHNEYDKGILDYPTLRVLVAYDGQEEHYLPTQQVLVLESISAQIPPNALRDLVKGAQLLASTTGIRELYFLDGGGGLDKFAEHRGFEEVPYRVFRMKL